MACLMLPQPGRGCIGLVTDVLGVPCTEVLGDMVSWHGISTCTTCIHAHVWTPTPQRARRRARAQSQLCCYRQHAVKAVRSYSKRVIKRDEERIDMRQDWTQGQHACHASPMRHGPLVASTPYQCSPTTPCATSCGRLGASCCCLPI